MILNAGKCFLSWFQLIAFKLSFIFFKQKIWLPSDFSGRGRFLLNFHIFSWDAEKHLKIIFEIFKQNLWTFCLSQLFLVGFKWIPFNPLFFYYQFLVYKVCIIPEIFFYAKTSPQKHTNRFIADYHSSPKTFCRSQTQFRRVSVFLQRPNPAAYHIQPETMISADDSVLFSSENNHLWKWKKNCPHSQRELPNTHSQQPHSKKGRIKCVLVKTHFHEERNTHTSRRRSHLVVPGEAKVLLVAILDRD